MFFKTSLIFKYYHIDIGSIMGSRAKVKKLERAGAPARASL